MVHQISIRRSRRGSIMWRRAVTSPRMLPGHLHSPLDRTGGRVFHFVWRGTGPTRMTAGKRCKKSSTKRTRQSESKLDTKRTSVTNLVT